MRRIGRVAYLLASLLAVAPSACGDDPDVGQSVTFADPLIMDDVIFSREATGSIGGAGPIQITGIQAPSVVRPGQLFRARIYSQFQPGSGAGTVGVHVLGGNLAYSLGAEARRAPISEGGAWFVEVKGFVRSQDIALDRTYAIEFALIGASNVPGNAVIWQLKVADAEPVACPLEAQCGGLQCGSEAMCGEPCGAICATGFECGVAGMCEPVSVQCPESAQCAGLECGLDPVCGLECGRCDVNEICIDHRCLPSMDSTDGGTDTSTGDPTGTASSGTDSASDDTTDTTNTSENSDDSGVTSNGSVGDSSDETTTDDPQDDSSEDDQTGTDEDWPTPSCETPCDRFDPNACAENFRCVGWNCKIDGLPWDTSVCAPSGARKEGESCNVPWLATENETCGKGLVCWDDVCERTCAGTRESPTCELPGRSCLLANRDAVAVCLPHCDPLAIACENTSGQSLCIPNRWNADAFVCVEAQGSEAKVGDGCRFMNACEPGALCLDASQSGSKACAASGEPSCCIATCDLRSSNSMCLDGEECVPYFPTNHEAQAAWGHVGICAASSRGAQDLRDLPDRARIRL